MMQPVDPLHRVVPATRLPQRQQVPVPTGKDDGQEDAAENEREGRRPQDDDSNHIDEYA